MKLKFIGLAASLCAVSFSNAMESSQPVKHEDVKHFIKIKESNNNIYIALCLAPKNNSRFSLSSSSYQNSEIACDVNLPTKLPKTLDDNNLKQFAQFSKIFPYLSNCSGDKNKVLEIACDYERQLAYHAPNNTILEYSSSLWNNYFESCNSKYMNLHTLQNHLLWKTMQSLGKLESLAKTGTITNTDRREAQDNIELYSKFVLVINDLQEKKARSIAKDFRNTLRKEYINLSTMFEKYAPFEQLSEEDKLPSKVAARMPGLIKFRDSLDSTKTKTKKRSNSTGSSSDEKKSGKKGSDSDNNNNNNNNN